MSHISKSASVSNLFIDNCVKCHAQYCRAGGITDNVLIHTPVTLEWLAISVFGSWMDGTLLISYHPERFTATWQFCPSIYCYCYFSLQITETHGTASYTVYTYCDITSDCALSLLSSTASASCSYICAMSTHVCQANIVKEKTNQSGNQISSG